MNITYRLQECLLTCALAGFIAGCGGGGGATVPPTIATQPAAASVLDGATASFSVSASGDAPLSYQWRRNGADLVDGPALSGATAVKLSMSAPYAFNASQIAVEVRNAAGFVVSGTALLTVTPVAPAITAQPANATVALGAPAVFTVGISGGTAPVSYQWMRNGVAIAGATSASFSMAATVAGDNGASFVVDVANPAGTVSSTAALLSINAAGKSWGPPVLVSSGNPLNSAGYPQVAMDAAGNAIGVWQEAVGPGIGGVRNAAWARRYLAGGGWSAAETIDDVVGSSAEPQLAITPAGVAVASFIQSTANNGGGVQMLSNRFNGTGWGSPSRLDVLDAVIDVEHSAAIAPSGAATVVFNQAGSPGGRSVMAARSSAAGIWSAPVVFGISPSYLPQVAVAANGDAVLAWIVTITPTTRSLWASRNRGTGWSTPVQVLASGQDLAYLHVRADAAGNATAVWQELSGTRSAVRAARLDAASGTWSAALTLNDGNHYAYEPDLAMANSGDTMVAWHEASNALGSIDVGVVARRYRAAAADWTPAAPAQPVGAPGGRQPKVALDSAGNAVAAWLQPVPGNGAQSEVWAANFNAAAAVWAVPVKLMTVPPAYTDRAPVLSVNGNGEAIVAWVQRTDAPYALGIWARVYR